MLLPLIETCMWSAGGICICRHLFQVLIIYSVFHFYIWQHVSIPLFPVICLENDESALLWLIIHLLRLGSKAMSHFLSSFQTVQVFVESWLIDSFISQILLSPAPGWRCVRCWGYSSGQDRCGPRGALANILLSWGSQFVLYWCQKVTELILTMNKLSDLGQVI